MSAQTSQPEPARPAGAERLSTLGEEVRRGLSLDPKQLQPKLFYDALGSALFDAICHLPWYRITRAEMRLLRQYGPRIVATLPDPLSLIELGCGNGEKIEIVGRVFGQRQRDVRIHLVDVSAAALERSTWALARLDRLSVVCHETTYEEGLAEAVAARHAGETLLVLFLGSNLGNFDHAQAEVFLTGLRRLLRPGDKLLLGLDLVKPEPELILAYDDPLGVTAAFNKNVLARLNRDLGADFDLSAFDHRAVWNAEASRVEMHLVSRRDQRVCLPGAACEIRIGKNEWLWTESSYKYEPDAIATMGEHAGFDRQQVWVEPEARFALTLFDARGTG